jgi:hypothetical protein
LTTEGSQEVIACTGDDRVAPVTRDEFDDARLVDQAERFRWRSYLTRPDRAAATTGAYARRGADHRAQLEQ